MRETPQLKHIEQVSDGWIKKYILTYVLPDGSDYIYEAASRKGLEAYRAELARLEARSNTAIAAIDEGADDFGAAAVAAAEQAAGTSGKRTADAVSIVPITRDGNLVLIREFRYPLNSWVVGLPAGLVEPGEDLAVAVDRELREETGYGLRTDIPAGRAFVHRHERRKRANGVRPGGEGRSGPSRAWRAYRGVHAAASRGSAVP